MRTMHPAAAFLLLAWAAAAPAQPPSGPATTQTPSADEDPLVIAGLIRDTQADYSHVVSNAVPLADQLAKTGVVMGLYRQTVDSQTAQLRDIMHGEMEQRGYFHEKQAMDRERAAWGQDPCSKPETVPPAVYEACQHKAAEVNAGLDRHSARMESIMGEVRKDPRVVMTTSQIQRAKGGIAAIERENRDRIEALRVLRARAKALAARIAVLRAAFARACNSGRTETQKHCSGIGFDNLRPDLPIIPPTPFD